MSFALVTGSSGFVAGPLINELRRRGWIVKGAVRREPCSIDTIDIIEIGEMSDSTDWSKALRGVDTVFHLAARVHQVGDSGSGLDTAYRRANADATAALAQQAVAAGARRFVFVSSVKAMGEASPERPFTECDPPQPQDAYGRSKLAAEQALVTLAGQIEVSIVRPPLVYGPGVRANFLSLLKLAAGGWPLPLGAARAPRSMVFIDNLVDALIACATRPHASPATYFVSDGRDFSVAELVSLWRSEMGRPARLWDLPAGLVQAAARALGRADAAQRLFSPLQVDSARIRRELGWSPPVTAEAGLRKTVRWFLDARAAGAI
ncbi:MAG: NAD-dependent epimerase/dehydratase family protein [Burkholderiales bacterium]|nr:NAD-dependent epimerase/dehydratase family protein [Burkholderiales bacterium]